jgi:putative ABC transport system permease protein
MLLNLRTIPARLGSSSVAIIGIAGVVVVFVSVLSISAGFNAAMTGSGSPGRAIVLRAGSDTELTSAVDGVEAGIIKQAPGIAKDGDITLATADLFVVLDLPRKGVQDSSSNVPMRGIEAVAMQVEEGISIVEGRMFRFGTNEAIVGRSASRQFGSLSLGDTIVSGQNQWQVVGIFEADGGLPETEIWTDVHSLQSVYRRTNSFSTVHVKLTTPDAFEGFRDWLMENPQTHVTVRREDEFYASQSETMTRLISTLGFGIAGLMGIGAIFGAVLTMYTAVANRTREIGTLRALGFNTLSVIVSVLAESMVLGAIGGLLGGTLAYLAFNGYQTSTMNFQTFSQVAFAFRVTPALLATGVFYALVIGMIGGLLPAIRAARLPIPTALREL